MQAHSPLENETCQLLHISAGTHSEAAGLKCRLSVIEEGTFSYEPRSCVEDGLGIHAEARCRVHTGL